MAIAETDICNLALGKFGGGGDQINGNAFLSSIDASDKVSVWCKLNFPRVRRRVIIKLAALECPFRSTVRFRDLGAQLDSDGLPEIGQYLFAFNLPGDCLEVSKQFYEDLIQRRAMRGPVIAEVQWETIANKKGTGKLFLTNTLTNQGGTSAFIEYAVDTKDTKSFSEEMIDCVATLLASELAPMVGLDDRTSIEMLTKYETLAVPNAQRANQRGFNNSVKRVPNYHGGRGSSLSFPAVNVGLGTYFNAEGDRRDIL